MNSVAKPASWRLAPIALAILCAQPILVLGQAVGSSEGTPAPIGKLVDVGGYRVHVYCTGAGSPTVVIVGAGFSFNWGLVQPEVAKFTQVCAYDLSGVGWSDSGPADSCLLQVSEVHTALKNAGIKGPYVLVGHSLGGLVARIYAGKYPDETAGMVFVDHATEFHASISMGAVPDSGGKIHPETTPEPATSATPSGPNAPMKMTGPAPGHPMGIEGDPNFSKLSARDRELHLWFMGQTRDQTALLTNASINPGCFADADAIVKEHPQPLGEKPLVDVSTDEMRGPGYVALQTQLLALSQNSKEIIAERSGHFVIIDRPDVVVEAIHRVVEAARSKAKL